MKTTIQNNQLLMKIYNSYRISLCIFMKFYNITNKLKIVQRWLSGFPFQFYFDTYSQDIAKDRKRICFFVLV